MSRPVDVTISHDLGKEEAKRRIVDGLDQLKSSITGGLGFKLEENWATEDKLIFSASGFGQTITGAIDIFPQHVRIEVMLPALLASAAEKITGKLQKQGQLLLEKK